jgi:DnaJ-domain-containing protein 1
MSLDLAALRQALVFAASPALVREAGKRPLPSGIASLLEIAAGDEATLEQAMAILGRSGDQLRAAAGFYVEQVLFHPGSDSYRVLGGAADSSSQELRRHMALLVRWLHPDVAAAQRSTDRTVFANRVTQAWEHLKTAERRTAYDLLLSQKPALRIRASRSKSRKPSGAATSNKAAAGKPYRPSRRTNLVRLPGDRLIDRLVAFLSGFGK